MAQNAEIVVIGAGMAGAAAAAHLAAHGRVILIEREAQPGYHSTGRSAALFTTTYGNLTVRTLTHASRAFYLAWEDGFTEHPILTPRGAMLYAPSEQMAALNEAWAEMSPRDPTLRQLDGKEARELVPALRPDRVEAAILEPEAMDIDVHNLHQGYLRLFRRRGGEIRTDAEVTALSRANGVWNLATRAGEFAAPIVVNAAGAWADVVAGMAGLPPVDLQPKRRTAMIVPAPLEFDTQRWPMVIDAEETGYFKPDAGKLLVSPADETPVEPQDIQPEELDVAIAIDRLMKATTLKIERVERKWAGLRSFVPDHTPVNGFDPLGHGFFWLAGQGGYGIMTAEGMAKTAASLITTGTLPNDIAALGITAEGLGPARFYREIAMNIAEQARKAEAFRALHAGPHALVMANAWDAMTARMFEAEGFPAIATTSGGVAGTLGFRDGEGAPWDEVVGQTARIARAVSVPVTADIEGGFGATPEAVGRNIGEIIAAGAVGVNLEDSVPGQGGMRTPEDAAARVRAARAAAMAAGVPIFINARVDLFIRHVGEGEEQLAAAIERGRAYLAAGADSIYPIGLRDEPTIKRLADALQCPININVRAGHPTVAALEALGVRRITTGDMSLAMLALSVVRDAVRDIRANGRFDAVSPSVTGADMAQLGEKVMARVRDIAPGELPADLAAIYEEFAGYGPFRNQVAVFAHVPAALRHLMPLLMELRAAKTLPKRALELAIVTVSQLNACHYCVAHHTPFLAVEGVSPAGAARILDYRDHPEFDTADRLVVEYAIAAWEAPNRIPEALFARLRAVFTEAQIVELTLRITLCGFFNKFNDALAIEDEQETVAG